jgi:arginine exporter protein ArgO
MRQLEEVVLPLFPLHWLPELVILLALLIIGVLIIIFVAKVLFFFLPAAIVALIVWFITLGTPYNKLLTGVAFLLIAAISIAKRK